MKKSTAETIAYAIKKECQRTSLYDWCDSWGITTDEFDEFLALAVGNAEVEKARNNMTEREAAEKLRAYHKCQRLQVKGIYEDCNEKLCDNCDLCYMQGTAGEHIKSIEMAIQALGKQIPKKPIFYAHDYYCSVCNSLVGNNEFEWKRFKYCDTCGQKLDWSDEE